MNKVRITVTLPVGRWTRISHSKEATVVQYGPVARVYCEQSKAMQGDVISDTALGRLSAFYIPQEIQFTGTLYGTPKGAK